MTKRQSQMEFIKQFVFRKCIKMHLCKIQKCTIMKNEKILGTWHVDGKNLRPKIWFHPMQDEMETAVLKSTLGNSKYYPSQGTYTVLHIFVMTGILLDIPQTVHIKI